RIRKIRKKLAEAIREPILFMDEPAAEPIYEAELPREGETSAEKQARIQRNKDRQEAIKGNIEELLNSEHKDIYAEAEEELRKLEIRKGKLGEDQVQKSYDLNRQDIAIL
ncbi:18945_t:CDS:2, partial [Funneliformis geosporum]